MKVFRAVCLISLCLWAALAVCPDGCACTGDVSICESCSPGFFNGNTDQTGTPLCLKCPMGCSACETEDDDHPTCTACDTANGWNLDDEKGKCFECDPECATCSGNPQNCQTCFEPFVHVIEEDNKGRCIVDEYCPARCARCNGSDIIRQDVKDGKVVTEQKIDFIVYCQECLSGSFLIARGCYDCKQGCSECSLDFDTLWTTKIGPFWVTMYAQVTAYLQQQGLPLDGLPKFDPQTITFFEKNNWAVAYYLFLYMKQMNPTQNNLALVLTGLNQLSSIAEIARPTDHWDALALFVNKVSQKNMTVEDVRRGIITLYQSDSVCSVCHDGFKFNDDKTQCVQCDSVCGTCDANGCTGCKPGFFLEGTTCTACDPTCLTCFGAATTCDSCMPPLSLTPDGTCVQCADTCNTCLSDLTSCIFCNKPFSTVADSAGKCFQCPDPMCEECDTTDHAICLKCRPGYINFEGKCQTCQQNCVSCSADMSRCFECKKSFVLHEGQCHECPRGCEHCEDPAKCEVCRPGNQLNFETKQCQKCEDGCVACSENHCQQFKGGFVEFFQDIVPCDPGCDSCSSDNPRVCLECKDKFYLDGSICKSCISGCEECVDGTTCAECRKGTFNNAGSCDKCAEGCKSCTSSTVCTDCFRGYTLNSTGVCVRSCPSGCSVCDPTDTTVCKQCKKGFALKTAGNSCVKCARHCSGSCNAANSTVCTSCSEGFMLINATCKKCPEGCITCTQDNCLACRPDMILQTVNGKDVCGRVCPSPCKTCSAAECLTCIIGYKVSEGACVLDTASLCAADCTFCPLGTELTDAKACQACTTANCTTCVNDVCTACWSGTYIDSTATPPACQPCAAECKTCFDAITCDECADGYYHELVSMTDGIQDAVFSDACSLCDDNCATCFIESTRCLSCKQGYKLTGNVCVGRHEVKIKVKFQTPYAEFISKGLSQTFLKAVAKHLGIDISKVDLLSVTEGSTEVVSSVSTSGASEADTIQKQASDTTAMVGSIGPIVSSSVGVTYDGEEVADNDEDNDEESRRRSRTGLIVGVVIGSVVLLGIIAFLIYQIIGNNKATPRSGRQQQIVNSESEMQNKPYFA